MSVEKKAPEESVFQLLLQKDKELDQLRKEYRTLQERSREQEYVLAKSQEELRRKCEDVVHLQQQIIALSVKQSDENCSSNANNAQELRLQLQKNEKTIQSAHELVKRLQSENEKLEKRCLESEQKCADLSHKYAESEEQTRRLREREELMSTVKESLSHTLQNLNLNGTQLLSSQAMTGGSPSRQKSGYLYNNSSNQQHKRVVGAVRKTIVKGCEEITVFGGEGTGSAQQCELHEITKKLSVNILLEELDKYHDRECFAGLVSECWTQEGSQLMLAQEKSLRIYEERVEGLELVAKEHALEVRERDEKIGQLCTLIQSLRECVLRLREELESVSTALHHNTLAFRNALREVGGTVAEVCEEEQDFREAVQRVLERQRKIEGKYRVLKQEMSSIRQLFSQEGHDEEKAYEVVRKLVRKIEKVTQEKQDLGNERRQLLQSIDDFQRTLQQKNEQIALHAHERDNLLEEIRFSELATKRLVEEERERLMSSQNEQLQIIASEIQRLQEENSRLSTELQSATQFQYAFFQQNLQQHLPTNNQENDKENIKVKKIDEEAFSRNSGDSSKQQNTSSCKVGAARLYQQKIKELECFAQFLLERVRGIRDDGAYSSEVPPGIAEMQQQFSAGDPHFEVGELLQSVNNVCQENPRLLDFLQQFDAAMQCWHSECAATAKNFLQDFQEFDTSVRKLLQNGDFLIKNLNLSLDVEGYLKHFMELLSSQVTSLLSKLAQNVNNFASQGHNFSLDRRRNATEFAQNKHCGSETQQSLKKKKIVNLSSRKMYDESQSIQRSRHLQEICKMLKQKIERVVTEFQMLRSGRGWQTPEHTISDFRNKLSLIESKKLDVIIRLEAFLSLYIETAAGCTTNREDIGNQMREETLEHLDAFFKMVGVTPALQSITELGISVFCFFGEVQNSAVSTPENLELLTPHEYNDL